MSRAIHPSRNYLVGGTYSIKVVFRHRVDVLAVASPDESGVRDTAAGVAPGQVSMVEVILREHVGTMSACDIRQCRIGCKC